ncbi:MAG: flagellar assembly protein FliH [Treponema sp.]|nr:flagellar assembly protein FliH [Treponema sp.]
MAQTVFRPNQVNKVDGEIILTLPKSFAPEVEEVEEVEPEYTGPTAEELKREADEFKAQFEKDKAAMIAQAHAEADSIVRDAQNVAFDEVKKQSDEASVIKNSARREAEKIIEDAKVEAARIISDAEEQKASISSKSHDEGFEKGREEGFESGKDECTRLIERIHKIIESVQNKRQEILDTTEQQIVDLVILMTRKVVKIMSDNQKSVIMANVVQALKKVKGRGDVTLRVNLADVKLTTAHVQDFIREVENIKNIAIVEDSSVEKGGCIVETDFGAVDARISSQLSELESKILEISPIKTVNKADVKNPDN